MNLKKLLLDRSDL